MKEDTIILEMEQSIRDQSAIHDRALTEAELRIKPEKANTCLGKNFSLRFFELRL